MNSFGAPRTAKASFLDATSHGKTTEHGEQPSYTTCGIWTLASCINHSCVSNCRRSFIGDVQLIRATKDLPANTELFFGYRAPAPLELYGETQKQLENWGFTCDCELYMDKKATPRAVLQRRKALIKDIKYALKGTRGTNVRKVRQVIKKLEDTYPAEGGTGIRLELSDLCFTLGTYLLSASRPADAVTMIVKGLEARGFDVIACPPNGDADSLRLEVRRWGLVADELPWAFLNLFRACQQLAPELYQAAKSYVEISYSMVVGEGETLCEVFPELA